MKADLHCHSHFSDGQHSPQYLLDKAAENGLGYLAITDHDCISAHLQTLDTHDISLISGVEISSNWEDREIHIVGLGFDINDTALNSLLRSQQASRRQRATIFNDKLEQLGIAGLQAYIDALPCQAVTRSHVAEFLVQSGNSKNVQKAFKKYLSRGGKAHVPADWCLMEEAVLAIRNAGGLAVLAHPGRYPLSKSRLQALLSSFISTGGDALEASYANIHPDMQHRLTELANDNELFISQGSDFHRADAHWTDLGKFPALGSQAQKNAIWQHPKWHSLIA